MKPTMSLPSRIAIRCAAVLFGVLLSTCPRPADALEICVQTLADLVDGLDEVEQLQADGSVTLRLVAQQYDWNGVSLLLPISRLNLLGGYNADCSARTVDPANTVINGLGQARLSVRRTALGITVEGVRFANMDELTTFDIDDCVAYGNTVTMRRSIVDGTDGFVFLSIFSWIGRKAWDVLLRAWYDEFDKHDDVTSW